MLTFVRCAAVASIRHHSKRPTPRFATLSLMHAFAVIKGRRQYTSGLSLSGVVVVVVSRRRFRRIIKEMLGKNDLEIV